MMEAIGVADSIATSLGTHLRQFDTMPVFILSPGSGAAQAAWLDLVGVRVHLELATGVAGSAARMSFHSGSPMAASRMARVSSMPA